MSCIPSLPRVGGFAKKNGELSNPAVAERGNDVSSEDCPDYKCREVQGADATNHPDPVRTRVFPTAMEGCRFSKVSPLGERTPYRIVPGL